MAERKYGQKSHWTLIQDKNYSCHCYKCTEDKWWKAHPKAMSIHTPTWNGKEWLRRIPSFALLSQTLENLLRLGWGSDASMFINYCVSLSINGGLFICIRSKDNAWGAHNLEGKRKQRLYSWNLTCIHGIAIMSWHWIEDVFQPHTQCS